MTRPDTRAEAVHDLIKLLDLETLEVNLFRGVSPKTGWQRVFGGQVIAQALVAAQRTVDTERHVHSLHAYFMRPGDPTIPIIYEVDRIRDGKSFTTRRVVALQHGHAIFSLSASFQIDEGGLDHQVAMPDMPSPDDLAGNEEIRSHYLANAPEPVRQYWERPRPVEFRPANLQDYFTREKREPVQSVWVRATGPIPDDRKLENAVLSYLSDMTLLDTALYAHGTSVFDRSLQVASLDHAMWFHRRPDFSDWLLYVQDSPSSSGARGMTRGSLFNRNGTLVASVAQEGLIRKVSPAQ